MYSRLKLLRNLKLKKQSDEITTLDSELEKLNNLIKQLSEISDEVNGNLDKNVLESWKLKNFSKFSSSVSEQLSISNNREKFINEEIKRAKIEYGKTHYQKKILDEKIEKLKKEMRKNLEQKIDNSLPPTRL